MRGKKLIEYLFGKGLNWEIWISGSTHYRAKHKPSGKIITVGLTPSDHRALLNARAQIKRIEREGSKP